MKIIYSGGWNNNLKESIQASFIFCFESSIKKAIQAGKKIAFITLAKPDGYFDELIKSVYKDSVEIINTSNMMDTEWSNYDGIFIPGGKATRLISALKQSNFNLTKLKKNVIILGDSAGAKVLSSYFFDSPGGELRGIEVEFIEGLNQEAKVITVAHKNNSYYCNDLLISKVEQFAKQKNIRVLILEENEQKLLQNDEFVEFDKNAIFDN